MESPLPKGSDFLSRIRDRRVFPAVPQIALEVVRLCDREGARPRDIGVWIGRDPALAARFVRMSNSAALGTSRRVATVDQAVHVLGLRAVRTITLASALVEKIDAHLPGGAERLAFWQDAVAEALASRALLGLCGSPHAEEGFLAGLVKEVGILGLLRAFREPYEALLRKAETEDLDLGSLESARLGGTHADVSAMLLDEWGFPVATVVAVRNHLDSPRHSPSEGIASALLGVLHATEGLGRLLRRPTDRALGESSRRLREFFAVDSGGLARLLGYVEANLVEIFEALGFAATGIDEVRENRRAIEQRLGVPAGSSSR